MGPVQNPTGCCPTVETDCCAMEVPATLFATFSNLVNCSGFNNQSIPLSYDDASQKWKGTGEFCDSTFDLEFWCNGTSVSDLTLAHTSTNCGKFSTSPQTAGSGSSCDPLSALFAMGQVDGCPCCSGGPVQDFRVTITE